MLCERGLVRISLAGIFALSVTLAAAPVAAEPGAKRLVRPAPATSPSEIPYASPARFFSIKEVLAKVDAARATKGAGESLDWPLRLASFGGSETPARLTEGAQDNEPFGLLTFRAPEGTLWRKWRGMEAGLAAEGELIDGCMADESTCTPAARRFLKIVEAVKAQTGRNRIAEANRDINAVVRYVTDYAQFGELDRWTTPLQTLASGRGDCEDYAIAKYAVLHRAGFAEQDMRLVLVHDRAVRADHAVLAVRHEGKWLILDNRHSVLNEDGEQRQFTPLFALDQDGVKLFAAPYGGPTKIEGARNAVPAPAASLDTSGWEMRGAIAADQPATGAWANRPLLI